MAFYQGYAPGMPGIGPTSYSRGRMIWAGLAGIQYLPVGGIIASALARDPDNFETGGNETEPETPPTTSGKSNIPALPGAIGQTAPTASAPGYSGILRAGLLMGRIGNQSGSVGSYGSATSGYFRPSILGVTTAAITAGAKTTITVTSQCANEVARLITLAGTSVSLTIVAYDTVNYATTPCITTSITCTAASGTTLTASFTPANSGAYAAGALICPADGSQYPISFVDEQYGLNMIDNYGNSVAGGGASGASASIAPFPRVPLAGGLVNVLNLVNYPSSANTGYATLQAWIKANLNCGGQIPSTITSPVNYGGKFNFTDDYGL